MQQWILNSGNIILLDLDSEKLRNRYICNVFSETPGKKNAEGKRFRHTTTRYEDQSETSTCNEQDVTQQKAKRMNLQKAAVTNFQNIASRMLDSNAIETNKLKLEVSNLKEEIAALKRENEVLRNFNIDLQQVVIEKFKNLVTTESSIHRVEGTNSNDQASPGAKLNGNRLFSFKRLNKKTNFDIQIITNLKRSVNIDFKETFMEKLKYIHFTNVTQTEPLNVGDKALVIKNDREETVQPNTVLENNISDTVNSENSNKPSI
ncbi:hypothetical protein RN001_009525 [Aquatica leii]|uniref:Uncharacterized protein n=1 Tax=Aquatica leii TaxID=1421715 RepID=A0AAN7SFN9_9COLE|nr:hypothetical protein RN001_009525 [Aquatica leii]